MKGSMRVLMATAVVAGLSPLAHAHFILVEPASWVVETGSAIRRSSDHVAGPAPTRARRPTR
jgi:hypothetical protein